MRFALAVLLMLSSPALISQELVEFENGQVADADELNGNFEALRQQILALEERLAALETEDGCLSLSSAGDGVLLGSTENLFELSSATSISAWVRLSESVDCGLNRCPILSIEQTNSSTDSLNAGMSLHVGWVGNEVRLVYHASDGRGGGNPSTHATAPLNNGVWHHIASVRDANSVSIYVDGQLSVTYDDDPTGAIDFDGGGWDHSYTWIGRDFPNGLGSTSVQGVFDGKMSSVGVWARALTATDIEAMYNDTFNYDASSPAGYWPLNETSGSIAKDVSAFGNNGVLEGVAAWSTDCR